MAQSVECLKARVVEMPLTADGRADNGEFCRLLQHFDGDILLREYVPSPGCGQPYWQIYLLSAEAKSLLSKAFPHGFSREKDFRFNGGIPKYRVNVAQEDHVIRILSGHFQIPIWLDE